MPTLCPTCLGVLPTDEAICPSCSQSPGSASTRAATAALLGLSLVAAACGDKEEAVALYGVEITDADDDGWGEEEGDCDDSDPDIYPGAEETPGDGVDSNCDGDDDT